MSGHRCVGLLFSFLRTILAKQRFFREAFGSFRDVYNGKKEGKTGPRKIYIREGL